ncbi:MAG: hypothetical protein R6W31_10720 [Bacteroidales bacterium]
MMLHHQIASLAVTLLLLVGTTGVRLTSHRDFIKMPDCIYYSVAVRHSGGNTVNPLAVIR